jgi:hypothetical protein
MAMNLLGDILLSGKMETRGKAKRDLEILDWIDMGVSTDEVIRIALSYGCMCQVRSCRVYGLASPTGFNG